MKNIEDKHKIIRDACEGDLIFFINTVAPEAALGHIHEELITWVCAAERSTHKLILIPRDHQKSRIAAFYTLWMLTKNPHYRILYVSSTENLASLQLGFIKGLMLRRQYRALWPEMVNVEESKRARWTATEIAVDHPIRAQEAVRDPSIFACGLTAGTTGMHADLIVLDDIVEPRNAYTEEGRNKVKTLYSFLASIAGTDSSRLAVGTRYHPNDIYGEMQNMEREVFTQDGEFICRQALYESFIRPVEEDGVFIWPRQKRTNGSWIGFDMNVLATKKAEYLDRTQFFAQYYNNPNDPDAAINRNKFQYFDRSKLQKVGSSWFYANDKLNLFASIDFAFSLNSKADYTAIVVIGMDRHGNILVLDIVRFRTNKISEYYEAIFALYTKWGFKKLRCEITSAQKVIVRDLKDNYIRKNNLLLSIDEYTPSRHIGSKEERIKAIIEPRYDNLQIWHFKGGLCEILEDEVILENPPHDDIKDALASAIDVGQPPRGNVNIQTPNNVVNMYNNRFGGVAI